MSELTANDLQLCRQVRVMCTCNQLRRTTRGVTQMYDAAMASSGLKVTQLPILVALGSAGDMPVTTLADALALDRTTLTRNLKVLEHRGLVEMGEREDDARVRMVSLTPSGSAALTGALARWEDVQRAVETGFGEQRLRALYDELAALSEIVGV